MTVAMPVIENWPSFIMSNSNRYIFFHLALSSLISVHSLTHFSDITALRAFKSSVKPSSIPLNSCLATWDFTTDPCSEPRVTHFICGITCSGNRVTHITLDSQGYTGTLTPLVSRLTQLIALDLAENYFYGPIPSSLSSLPNLQQLILRVNSFSGSVPQSLTSLKSLRTLDLSHNFLSGLLPNSINSLTSLTRLDLSYNRLTGFLPKLPPNLNELAVKANSLSGPLYKSSFEGLTQLMVVELSENSFTRTLEPWFFFLPSLQQINLANNSFTSVVVLKPVNINSQLVAINLSFNRIEGFLPANFADYPMLRSLSLSYNRFRGPIPWQYSKKKGSLQRLFLDGNFLNGSAPAGFFAGGTVVSGSLGDNCLRSCPVSSELCLKSQKPASICQQAYGGKKPRS